MGLDVIERGTSPSREQDSVDAHSPSLLSPKTCSRQEKESRTTSICNLPANWLAFELGVEFAADILSSTSSAWRWETFRSITS